MDRSALGDKGIANEREDTGQHGQISKETFDPCCCLH